MSFIEQAAKIFESKTEFAFQAVMFGRNAIYVEGAKPIKLDSEEMIFKTAATVITVKGSGMIVKELSGDCTAVVGRIDGFSVSDL